MKKMAIAFQTFKKNLNKDYVKKVLTPDFEKDFKNQRPYWDAFVQYKSSEASEQHKPKRMRARKNTSIILAREVTRRLFRSGRRWKRTSFQEERTGNLQLAAVSKVLLLCSRRHIEHGRWLVCH